MTVVFKKLLHIVKGWGRAAGILSTSTAEAKLSALRMKICGSCEQAKPSKLMEIINGKAEVKDMLVCKKCHCPCIQKSLVVDENCPIAKW